MRGRKEPSRRLYQMGSPTIRQLILLVKSCQAMIQVFFLIFFSCNLSHQLFMAIMTTGKLTYEREFENSGQKKHTKHKSKILFNEALNCCN